MRSGEPRLITTDIAGYQHSAYAHSLAEFGTPRLLPRSGGWVLERPIPGMSDCDAMGCYPLFSCPDWSGLKADLDELAPDLVCISLVADPFGNYSHEDLQSCFGHKVLPFKQHLVADLGQPVTEFVSKHHRYYSKRALDVVDVERCDRPTEFLEEWLDLYSNLIAQHQLSGIKAFSRQAFAAQLRVPGIVMLRALHGGETVSAHLWYVQHDVVHSHLAATNSRGYELMAPYALHWLAFETFAGKARWLNFGGGAGLHTTDADGLTKFKRGWSTESRTAYFCGRIFNEERYAQALDMRGASENDYFPAYRKGDRI